MVYLFWAFLIGLIALDAYLEAQYRARRESIKYMEEEYNKRMWL